MEIAAEILSVLVASVVSLIVLLWLTKVGGKRQIAQMNTFDYVNSITIGSIAAEMATNLEQWYRPLTALIVYGLAAWLVHRLSYKSLPFRIFMNGTPNVLMENGVISKKELGRAGIDLNEFLCQARMAGYFDLNEVESALLETSGQISFLPKSEQRPATAGDLGKHPAQTSLWYDLVIDGHLMQETLTKSGKDRIWLDRQLAAKGLGQIGEVFYAACDGQGNFFACRTKE